MNHRSTTGLSLKERQEKWLFACLKRNQHTRYGQQYRFADISSVNQYQNSVPIVTYDELGPWVQGIADGEKDVLFSGAPVAFERTGGSTSGAKLIPYSEAGLADFRNALLPWLAQTIQDQHIDSGGAYWAISPACRGEEATAHGIPIGLPEGAYLGMEAGTAMAAVSIVPPWVGQLQDVDAWRLATVYHLLCRDDLVLISVWSPTFFLLLLDYLDSHSESLATVLQQGGNAGDHFLAPDLSAAARFQNYMGTRETAILWPVLKLVSCWMDGASNPFYQTLRSRLPHAEFQGKGLLATEGVVTVPNRQGQPVLTPDSGFYEFIDDNGHCCLAHELEQGHCYDVVMTTAGGLYRYRIGDQIRCDGWNDDVPVLLFLGRAGLATDLVGEKLTESFVAGCLENVNCFRMLVPVASAKPHYALVVEKVEQVDSHVVEQALCENPQYAYARQMGQLGSLEIVVMAKAMERYLLWATREGRRLGDVKIPPLATDDRWLRYQQERCA